MPAAHRLPSPIADALRLLPRAPHGRAAVTRRALPHVLVAQHLVVRDHVLLRIPAGQIESRLLDGTVLAYHAQTTSGWAEDAPGVQLIGPVTTVRPEAREYAAFTRPGRAATDPRDTLYARLRPRLATVRPAPPHADRAAAGSRTTT